MDWEFINIFKKAEFNTLMLSVAIAGWIMDCWLMPNNPYVVGAALMASTYCVIRLVVFCYNYIIKKRELKAETTKQNEMRIKAEKDKLEKWDNEISRMFYGLSEENKSILAIIYLKGKKDPINYNVLHFPRFGEDFLRVNKAQEITSIFRDEFGAGMHCITIHYYTDTIAVSIDPYLYNLMKRYVDDNQLCLKEDKVYTI